jgi:hypothetical protein
MLEIDVLVGNMLPVKETQYIFPPRAQAAIPLKDACLFADMGWKAQLKYNDARLLVKYGSSGKIELWTRHAEKFRSYTAPDWLISQLREVGGRLGLQKDSWSLLDGGLLDFKHVAIRDTIVVWDILVQDGKHLLGTTYQDRYNLLVEKLAGTDHTTWWYTNPTKPNIHPPLDFGIKVHDNILIPRNYLGNRGCDSKNDGNPSGDAWQMLWDEVVTVANAPYTIGKPGDRNYSCHPVVEGLMIKNPLGKLEMGFRERNNCSWQVRSRVRTGRHIC